MIKASTLRIAELTQFFHSEHFVMGKIPCCDFSDLAIPQQLLLLLALGFLQSLGTPRAGGHPQAAAGRSRSCFSFHFPGPFFRRLASSPDADHDWESPEHSAWCCTLYRWTNSTAQLFSILQTKDANSSSFLAVDPYVLHHVACHECFGKLITFHCAKHSHYLASLSVPSV